MVWLRNPSRFLGGGLVLALSGFSPTQAAAQEAVDVELVLAVDVSLSMSQEELRIQRDGYVAALTHEDVIEAIRGGVHGRIALAYFEWAGEATQYLVVPWTVVAGREDAERVAGIIANGTPGRARRTSISGALRYAADLLAESGYKGFKRVVDVSGDGPNNQGGFVDAVRDALVADGIVINGLPLMTRGGMATGFEIPDLDRYYADCVVGGPGSFVIPVNEWDQFPEAIRRKLVQEIAAAPPHRPRMTPGARLPVVKAAAPYDCQVGEKQWPGRNWMWDEP